MRFFAAALALICLLVLSGCQMKAEYWVNADGSGKLAIDYTCQTRFKNVEPTLEADDFVRGVQGVQRWEQIKFEETKGRYRLRAVGYFEDVEKVAFKHPGFMQPKFKRENGVIRGVWFEVAQDGPPQKPAATQPAMDDQQALELAREHCRKLIAETDGARGSGRMNLEINRACKVEFVIHLPGDVEEPSYVKASGNTVVFEYDGEKVYQAFRGVLNEPETVARLMKRGEKISSGYRGGPEARALILQRVWGATGPLGAKCKAGGQIVDARAATGRSLVELMRTGGIIPAETQETAGYAATWDAVKVEPMSGTKLAVLKTGATTQKPYYMVAGGMITKVTDADGTVLLPGQGERYLMAARPEADKEKLDTDTTISEATAFTIQARLPQVKERYGVIQGYVRLVTGEGVKVHDMGLMTLESGAKGTELGLEFEEISGQNAPNSKIPGLRMNLSFYVRMATGVKPARILIQNEEDRTMQIDYWVNWPWRAQDRYEEFVTTGGQMTPKGHVKVFVIQNPRVVLVPFKWSDVPASAVQGK